ncbi:MAG TPA: S41 family peptidase, partial [Thermoanaerobaculia bacterium]
IVKKNGGVWLNNDVVMRLHVDDDPEPLKEMRRLVDRAAKQREGVRVATVGLHAWGELAMRDLEAMRTAILENHPGPVDPLNPDFRKWLDTGYEQALAKAREARTYGGYANALRYYGAGFRDGHLNSGTTLWQAELWWPRFVVRLRNDRYVVAATADEKDSTLPPAGAELLECDGRSARTMVEQDLWPYAQGPMIDSAWPIVAADLLIDRGNPWVPRAKMCRFRIGDETKELALHYRRGSDQAVNDVARRAVVPLAPLPPVRSVGNGLWVSMPAFQGADERLTELANKAPEWRNAAFIVFDVRGNTGGNSKWGHQILNALYGQPFLQYAVMPHFAKQVVDWRTSKDNIEHVRGFGAGSAGVVEGMEKAAAEGRELWRRDPVSPEPPAKAEPLYRGRVVLLTDRRCASACLDFADLVRLLPNAMHVGLPTSADSVYMEVRPVDLPSGVGRLGLPVKVYRDRPRGHNEPYVPHVIYDGDINDTAKVEEWVLARLSS